MQRAQAAAIASIRPARTLEIDHLAVQYCLEHELITLEMKLYVQGQLSRRPPLEALADLFPKQAGIMYDDPVMSATPMQNISAGLDRYPIVTFQVALLFCSQRTPVGIATLIRALKTAKVKTLVMAAHDGMSIASLDWAALHFNLDIVNLDDDEDPAVALVIPIYRIGILL